MDPATIADKYIPRDGTSDGPRLSFRLCKAEIGDISTVARFLAYQENTEWSGGVKGGEAWLAFCRIVGLPAGEFRKVITE